VHRSVTVRSTATSRTSNPVTGLRVGVQPTFPRWTGRSPLHRHHASLAILNTLIRLASGPGPLRDSSRPPAVTPRGTKLTHYPERGLLARQPRVGLEGVAWSAYCGTPGGITYPTGRERPRRHDVATLSQASASFGNRGRTRQERTPERHIKNLVSVCRLRLPVWRARPERR
jgi:hypothetical protein